MTIPKNTFFNLLSTDFGVQPYQRISENINKQIFVKEKNWGIEKGKWKGKKPSLNKVNERILWHLQLAQQFWITLTSQQYNQINSRCIQNSNNFTKIFYKIYLSALWKKGDLLSLGVIMKKKRGCIYSINICWVAAMCQAVFKIPVT